MGLLAAFRCRDAHALLRALTLVLALAGIVQAFGSSVAIAAPDKGIQCLAIPDEEPAGHAADFSCCLIGCRIGVILPAPMAVPGPIVVRAGQPLGKPMDAAALPDPLHLLAYGPRGPPFLR